MVVKLKRRVTLACLSMVAAVVLVTTSVMRRMRFLWDPSPAWLQCRPEQEQEHSAPIDRLRMRVQVPRVIHQTWRADEPIPERWQESHGSCVRQAERRNMTVVVWTDAQLEALVAEHYAWFLPVYRAYPHAIQRIDAARYFLLHRYGGFYIDMDVGCDERHLLDLLRVRCAPLFLPRTRPIGYSNDLIMSAPRHPLLSRIIHALPYFAWIRTGIKSIDVLASTGPLFLSIQTSWYLSSSTYGSSAARLGVSVLNDSYYGGDPLNSFFFHVEGNSWHENDAPWMMFAWSHWLPLTLLLVVFVVSCCLGICVSLRRCTRRRHRHSIKSWIHRS